MTERKFNILTLVLLNISFWCCTYYPKHILEIGVNGIAVLGTLLNVSFVLVLFSFFNFFVLENKSLFSVDVFKNIKINSGRIFFFKFVVLIVVQMFGDFLFNSLMNALGKWQSVFENVFAIVLWLVFFLVLVFKANVSINKSKKHITMILLSTLIVICFFMFVDISISLKTIRTYEKYLLFNSPLIYITNNFDFYHSVIAFLIDTTLGISIITILMPRKIKEKNRRDKKQNSYIVSKKPCLTILRCGIIFGVVFFISGVKVLIYPNNSLSNVHLESVISKSYIYDDSFEQSTKEVSILRHSNLGIEQTSFELTKVFISCCSSKEQNIIDVGSFYVDAYDFRNNYVFDGTEIKESDVFKKYDIDGNTSYLYKNVAICYVDNYEPKTILLDNLSTIKENVVVTGVLKKMIAEGNITAFEYGAEYLLKYNKDFFEPIVKRYSSGNFNTAEIAFLDAYGYQSDYIINIAKSLLI